MEATELMHFAEDKPMEEVAREVARIKVRDRKRLISMVKEAAEATSSSDSIPVLKHIKLEVKREVQKRVDDELKVVPGNAIFITGTNGDLTIINAAVFEEGDDNAVIEADRKVCFLVPAKLFSGILEKLPGTGDLIIEAPVHGKGTVKIIVGKSSFTIPALEAEMFPSVNVDKAQPFVLDAAALSKALNAVVTAVAEDEAMPVLTGVHLEKVEGGVRCNATDRRRVVRALLSASNVPEFSVILPSDTVKVLTKQFAEGQVNVLVSQNQVVFVGPGKQVISSLLDGSYPNIEKAIPNSFVCECLVKTEDMLGVCNRAMLLAGKDTAIIFEIKGGEILSEVKGENGSNGGESICIEEASGEIRIGLAAKLAQKVFSSFTAEKIWLKFGGEHLPVLVESAETTEMSPEVVGLIIPVRIQKA